MTEGEWILDEELAGFPKYKFYGKTPIALYAFIFSPFVGGILMAINLFQLKKLGAAIWVAIISLIVTVGIHFLSRYIPYQASSRLVVLGLNLVAGNILIGPVWRSQIGRTKFRKRNPWYPLLIIFMISIPVVFAATALIRFFA